MIDNQFIVEEQKKPMLIAAYQGQVKKMEEMLLNMQTGQNSKEIQNKIELLKSKIAQLSKQTKSHSV